MTINGLECKVVGREGKNTEIEFQGQRMIVPSECLPASQNIGSVFKVFFLEDGEALMAEKKVAKRILEEILNGK